MSLLLLNNVNEDTVGDYVNSTGFQGMMRISGDLDGGTITIEIKGRDNSNLPIQDSSKTAINTFTSPVAISTFSIPSGIAVRARLTGSGSPVNVSVSFD